MRRPRSLAVFAALLLGLLSAACTSLVPFTQELRIANGLSSADLKNLQFYVSTEVTLRRELASGSRQVTGGHKLRVVSGKTIEEVVIEAKTPGVVVSVTEGTLAVSFEPGSSLIFAASVEPGAAVCTTCPAQTFAEPPGVDPFPGNEGKAPELLHSPAALASFGGNYWLSTTGGEVVFQGTRFRSVDDADRAQLLIDSESLQKVVKNRKVLPGMRLEGR